MRALRTSLAIGLAAAAAGGCTAILGGSNYAPVDDGNEAGAPMSGDDQSSGSASGMPSSGMPSSGTASSGTTMPPPVCDTEKPRCSGKNAQECNSAG